MPFVFDGVARTITEERMAGDPALVEYSILEDLYIPAAVWWHTNNNSKYYFPFRLSGGGFRRLDSEGNELFATADIFLQNQVNRNWRLVAADYEHEIRFSSANLFREDPGEAMWDLDLTLADVVVEFEQSDVNTVIKTAGESGTGLTAAQINAIGDAIAARAPQAIWEYSDRTLTEIPPGSATAAAVQSTYLLLQQIGNQVDQGDIALSSEQLGRIASAVWANAARTLTVTPISPNDIWTHPTRELTGQAAGTLTPTQVNEIAAAVWTAATRELTGQAAGTLTSAQVDAIAASIWGAASRGASLDQIYKWLGLNAAHAQTFFRDAQGNTGYIEVDDIRLERNRTIGPGGEQTIVQQRTSP